MATITGTSGNDVLDSNLLEDDIIQGQGGNDLFRYYLTAWDDVIVDTGGDDTIQFDSALDFKAFAMFRWGDDLYIDLQDSGTITVENHFLSTNNRIETLEFDGYTFDLTATNLIVAQEDTVASNFLLSNPNGTSGDDLIFVGMGQEQYTNQKNIGSSTAFNTTYAGDGNDTIFANYAFKVYAESGNDTVYANTGTIWLGEGNDTFYAVEKTDFPNNDIFVAGGDGNDEIHGSSANDSLHGEYGNNTYPTYVNGVPIYDITHPGDDTIYGYGGNDSIQGGGGNDNLYGGDGDDDLFGDDGDDKFYGGDGNDEIWTGDGIDLVYGGTGDDHIRSYITGAGRAIGDKTIYAENGNDLIYDGYGNDYLDGGIDDDTIFAFYGSDLVYGRSGNDYLFIDSNENEVMSGYGSAGNDFFFRFFHEIKSGTISGIMNLHDGLGNDTYTFRHSDWRGVFYDLGTNHITDNAGSHDTLLLLYGNLSDINFTVLGDDLIIDFDQAIGSITIKNHFTYTNTIEDLEFGSFNISTKAKTVTDTYSFVERLTTGNDGPYYANSTTSFIGSDRNIVDGLAGNDEIHLGVGADIAYGREGNDEIYGGDGNDVILGGAQDDTLYGGNDDDTLIGGTGADNLYGNSGFDTADYSSSYLAVNIDLLYGTASGGDATGDTFTGIEAVIGSNTAGEQDNIWGDANSNSLYGMGGDDTLQGGGGADYIDGGTGWDTASYDRSYSGVNINLETGVHTGGQAAGDTLVNIEAITGSDYDDTLYGDDTENYFYGGNGDDRMIGGKSQDQFWGQGGADTLAFLDTNDLDAADLFHDFDTLEGDALDISAILVGYDPLTDAIADFVSITDNGTDSFVAVDVDGGADNFITIAQLNGVTGLNAQDMETDGNLITTTI